MVQGFRCSRCGEELSPYCKCTSAAVDEDMSFKKFDGEKAPLQMIPFHLLHDTARVFAYGAKKYGRDNWRSGLSAPLPERGEIAERYQAAIRRHLDEIQQGNLVDAESGHNHIDHILASAIMLKSYLED